MVGSIAIVGNGVSVGNIGTAPTQDERAKATSIIIEICDREI